jgi:hypothetical protein
MADHDHHHHAPTWQQLAAIAADQKDDDGAPTPTTPGPRSSHALVFVAPSYVYLLAGELTPRVPVDDKGAVWRLNLDENDAKWERVPTTGDAPPPPCIAPAAAALGSSIFLFGGRTAIDMQQGTLGDVYKLDTTTHRWETVWKREKQEGDDNAAANAPAPRSYHAAASLGGKLFIFGGCGPSGRLNDLWAFDPDTRTWERMPDPPKDSVPPRGGASLAALPAQQRLVVVGGFDGTHERADAHAFDVARKSWCSGPEGCASCAGDAPTLPARSVLGVAAHTGCASSAKDDDAACAHGGHVVAFGGECDPSVTRSHDTAGRFLGDVWCGDGARGDWHPLATAGGPGPGPRGWFASCAVPGGLVLHGGLDASNTRLSDCWRLRFGH